MIVLMLACAQADLEFSEDLEVLTYNVHGLPSAITGDDTTGRFEQIAPLLKDYNLMGIQEDFMLENHEILTDSLDHVTQAWFSEMLEDRYYGSGLSTFSHFKTLEIYTQHYSTCNGTLDYGSDCLASKGFLRVRLELAPGLEIDVYNSHLEAGNDAQDTSVRTEQVRELLDEIELSSADRSVIFMGDTNLKFDIPEEMELLNQIKEEGMLTDCCEQMQCSQPQYIDRIFFRGSSDLEITAKEWLERSEFFDEEGEPLSDHPAVSCLLGLKANF